MNEDTENKAMVKLKKLFNRQLARMFSRVSTQNLIKDHLLFCFNSKASALLDLFNTDKYCELTFAAPILLCMEERNTVGFVKLYSTAMLDL